MKRRAFVKTTSVSSLACAIPPVFPHFISDEYSTEELMGKAVIDLFGEGINLRKEAYESFVEM